MKSIEVPALYSYEGWHSTVDAVFDLAKKNPQLGILEQFVDDKWHSITTVEFAQQVENVARGLIALGVQPGDRIALISSTRYEWPLFDFAIWAAGGVTVSVYESSAAEQIQWILEDSQAVGVIIENDHHAERMAELEGKIPNVQWVYQIDSTVMGQGAVSLITQEGSAVDSASVHARIAASTIDDTASLIYTSGTTGKPKGVVLTHRNFISEALSIINTSFSQVMKPGSRTLFFLPLAHVFARAVSIACFIGGAAVGHFGNPNLVVGHLPDFKPDFLISVPRVLEKIYAGAHSKAVARGKGDIFDKAADIAVEYSKCLDTGKIPLTLRIKHKIFTRLVFSKLLHALGGKCKLVIAGGAPLGDFLAHFFRGIGLPVYEGYGLTETTAAICVNTIDAHKTGTVGRPLSGQGVMIAEDGEILLKGDVVFKEYWKNPTANEESIVDGWFRSGDLGKLDDEGYLSITGRKKEILVTAGGKNVAPAPLEDIIRRNELVSNVMLIGDKEPFIGAFITLDPAALASWKERNQKPLHSTIHEISEDKDLIHALQVSIDEANKTVSRAEGVKKFRILEDDFTVDNGELTQSLKIKRNEVLKNRKADYDWIYAHHPVK